MRIVHISDCYLPRMGGIETQVSGLVEYQKSKGHEVFVLTLTPGDKNAGIIRLPFKLPANLLWHPRGKSLAIDQLSQLKPDVVHLHFGAASPFAWQGLRAVTKLGLPNVATIHSIWGKFASGIYGRSRRSWKASTIISSVSEVSSKIVSATLNREVSVVPNGIDVDFWRTATKFEQPQMQIVSATRFASRKRIRPQLAAIESVVKVLKESSPHFTIAGNGPDFEKIKTLISKKNLSKYVTLTGRLNKNELRDLYAKSDIFLQMSVLEAFGIAACDGVSEFVQNSSTGYLEENDAEIVARILQLNANRESLKNLKSQSKNQPPIQTWDHAGTLVEALYQRSIEHA
ncbi:MAG: glycosyltransferase [Actinobacteria bacterium]|nr:glycosyltransferase [Actinomycetota bacterium]